MNTIYILSDEAYEAEQAWINSLPKTRVTIISIWNKLTNNPPGEPAFRYDILVPKGTRKETLDRAYGITNVDERPLPTQVCATTAGDVMILNGKYYLVDPIGFHPLTEAEAGKIERELSPLQTTYGYAWLVKQGLL